MWYVEEGFGGVQDWLQTGSGRFVAGTVADPYGIRHNCTSIALCFSHSSARLFLKGPVQIHQAPVLQVWLPCGGKV